MKNLKLPLLVPCILICSVLLNAQNTKKQDYLPLSFVNKGSKVNGRFYKAERKNPAPTVILLHGFPGGTRDMMGFGNKLSQDGMNAYTFNYRGTWKSEGMYLPGTSLEDVIKSVAFLKSPKVAYTYNIDTTNIILLGYSYGSCLGILASLHHASVKKIISVGTTDLSVTANMIEKNDAFRKIHQEFLDKYMSDPTIARGWGAKVSHEWIIEHKNEFDVVKHAKEFVNKQILLIGGWKDLLVPVEDHTIPIYRAFQQNEVNEIEIKVYDTDHSFRNKRDEIYQCVLNFIQQ